MFLRSQGSHFPAAALLPTTIASTVKPVLKDNPIGHKNVVCQDRWSLVTGSVILK